MIGEIFSVESFVWTCLWQSMALIVAGLAASFFLRRRSSRAHQILLLSIVAAVIVPVVSTLVKHYELGMFVAEPVVMQSQLEDQVVAGDHSLRGRFAQDFGYEPGPIEGDMSPVMAGSQRAPLPWARIVLYVWIAASVILAIRLLVTFVLGVRLLGRSEPLDCAKMEEAVLSARAKLGIDREVEVCSSRGVRSPVIWCWKRRPVLLVPGAVGRCDSAIDWTGVLCHELAHWKRRDHISGLLAEIAVCALPWHLLLWWAKSRLISLSEQACDDWVLATGQPGADYAESLLDLAPAGQMAFVPTVVSSKKGLAGRVRRILKDSCGNPRTGAAWAVAVSTITICVALGVAFAQTRPAKPDAESAAAEPDESSVAKVDKVTREYESVTLRYADAREVADHIREALQHISGQEPRERVLIQPLKQAGQIVIFGPKDRREIVKNIIAEFDQPTNGQAVIVTKIFTIRHRDPEELVRLLRRPPGPKPAPGQTKVPVVLIAESRYKCIIATGSAEDIKWIGERIEQLDREPARAALPAGWSLDYDDGRLAGGAGHWIGHMAKDLASLRIMLKPYDPSKVSLKGEEYKFRVFSPAGEHMGNINVIPETESRPPSSKVFRPGKYILKYERRWGKPGDNFRMNCGEYPIDLSKPGMYELTFMPKIGTAEITGTSGGCYAINFEKIGNAPWVRGYAYINRKKEYRLDGLSPGTYRLSAVAQQQTGDVIVSQAQVTIENETKVTVDIAPPPKGDCSLKGSILGEQKKYKTPWPDQWPESEGKWYVLIRKRGSDAVGRVEAYEALTMDSLYVIRLSSIVQQTQDQAQYHIEGVAPGQYTVTAIEHPSWGGCTVTRQLSKNLTLKAGEEAVLDFDLQTIPQNN